MQTSDHATKLERVRQALAQKPDGILEQVAAECGVPLQAVIECVPGDGTTRIDGAHFVEVLTESPVGGDITFHLPLEGCGGRVLRPGAARQDREWRV